MSAGVCPPSWGRSRASPRSAVGGPFVPVRIAADASAFDRQLYRINVTRVQVEKLNRE